MENVSVDPRIRRSQDMLLGAFRDLMAEKSFQSITVRDITIRAGVNRSTFYAHYRDKHDLMQHSLSCMFRDALRDALPDASEFHCDDMKRLIAATCEFMVMFDGKCSPVDKAFSAMIQLQVQAELERYIGEWLEAVEGDRCADDRDSVAAMVSWTIFGAGMQYKEKPDPRSLPELVERYHHLLLHGMGEAAGAPG